MGSDSKRCWKFGDNQGAGLITSQEMARKFTRALKEGGDLFDLNDIISAMETGHMQGHVFGNTWVVTRVHDWPKKRSVEITMVVGRVDEALNIEAKIEEWARSLGATLITAIGRDGWWKIRTPGWKKLGILYAKELT